MYKNETNFAGVLSEWHCLLLDDCQPFTKLVIHEPDTSVNAKSGQFSLSSYFHFNSTIDRHDMTIKHRTIRFLEKFGNII